MLPPHTNLQGQGPSSPIFPQLPMAPHPPPWTDATAAPTLLVSRFPAVLKHFQEDIAVFAKPVEKKLANLVASIAMRTSNPISIPNFCCSSFSRAASAARTLTAMAPEVGSDPEARWNPDMPRTRGGFRGPLLRRCVPVKLMRPYNTNSFVTLRTCMTRRAMGSDALTTRFKLGTSCYRTPHSKSPNLLIITYYRSIFLCH